MKITENFTLEEMTRTSRNIGNNPTLWQIANLEQLCVKILQPLRDAYGQPITVNSGFRSRLVNEAVGGVAGSQHMYGQAADITAGSAEENRKLFELVQSLDLPFDQLIDEKDYRWIHVSYSSRNRRQVLHLK